MIHFEKCWTGRRGVQIGPLAVGFGPFGFVTRIAWGERLVYVNQKAQQRYWKEAWRRVMSKEARRNERS